MAKKTPAPQRAGTEFKDEMAGAVAGLRIIAQRDRLGFLALVRIIREVEKNATTRLTGGRG